MIKFLVRLWKDEDGFDTGGAAGGAASGAMTGSAFGPVGTIVGGIGGAILGGFSGKKKKEEVYDPYAAERLQYKNYTSGNLGKTTPYTYNSAFDIEQPVVEKAAESTILGKLNNPTSNVSDYSAATKQYSDAYKASQQEIFDRERNQAKDMYNRLGLVSSTPGLTAQTDINKSQRIAADLSDADLMYKNLDRTLTAQGLDVNQLNSILSQASTLGQTQRQSQQFGQQMSMTDIERQMAEEDNRARLMSAMLGQILPERTVSYTPNTAAQLLGVVQNQGTGSALSSILGK